MKRENVQSTTVKSIGYDPENGVLQIEFVSGRVYNYLDVAAKVHEDFLAAKSKGHFFHTKIKGEFYYEKVIDDASTQGSGSRDLRSLR